MSIAGADLDPASCELMMAINETRFLAAVPEMVESGALKHQEAEYVSDHPAAAALVASIRLFEEVIPQLYEKRPLIDSCRFEVLYDRPGPEDYGIGSRHEILSFQMSRNFVENTNWRAITIEEFEKTAPNYNESAWAIFQEKLESRKP